MSAARLGLFALPIVLDIVWMLTISSGARYLMFSLLTLPLYAGAAGLFLGVTPRPWNSELLLRLTISLWVTLITAAAMGVFLFAVAIAVRLAGFEGDVATGLALVLVVAGVVLFWVLLWPWLVFPVLCVWPHHVEEEWAWWGLYQTWPGLRLAVEAAVAPSGLASRALWGVACAVGITAVTAHGADMVSLSRETWLWWLYTVAALPVLFVILVNRAHRAFLHVHPETVAPARTGPPTDHVRAGAADPPKVTMTGTDEPPRHRPIQIAYKDGCGVDFYPADPDKPVDLYSGPRGDVGIRLSVADALSPRWVEHMRIAGAEWFLEYLRALAHGRPMDMDRLRQDAARHRRT